MPILNQPLGNIVKWEKSAFGISIQAENAWVQITLFSAGVSNICISKQPLSKLAFSYSVIQQPQPIDFKFKESEKQIEIINENYVLQIQKSPVRFNFLTLEGKTICADDPAFGTSWIGNEVTTYKTLQKGERFIGLGEKTGNIDRRGKAYTNWNTDNFAYGVDADPLYSSIPFYIGIHNQLCYGIFLDNSHKTVFNFGASSNRFSYFSAEDGEMNYYFIYRNSVAEILQDYTLLTGRMELPPLWSLGLHQCRYSYYPDKEVMRIAQTYREKDIPCDAMWLDIHYMEDYKVFTFNSKKFSNPKKLTKQLKELGFRTVVIIDPGIKAENGYEVYDDGLNNNAFVQYPDQTSYKAEVWPGWSCFPDFTDPEVRNWWGKWMKFYTENGVEGFWNDMNEPASWGQHTPDLIEFNYEGERATHKKARNVYGMQMARATYEGTKKQLNGQRSFVLTRAAYSGIQRYAAVWTGDNVASDEHMLLGVRMVNSLGLSGVPFSGYDVGGFAGEASVELFARWISIGAFSPFFRCHSMINSKSAEPWSFGEKSYEIARNYVKLRYRLLPYIYSAFSEASQTGLPVACSLAIQYPHDEKVYLPAYQNQYLFGPSILVAPVESNKEFAKVYLPEGRWYSFYTDKIYEGNQEIVVESPLEKLPLFIKAGSIIPMQSDSNSTTEAIDGILNLHIYNGEEGSEYQYYEDDGLSYRYNNNEFYSRIISRKKHTLRLDAVSGNYQTKFNNIKIYWHGFKMGSKVRVNNKDVELKNVDFNFMDALSNFDPFSKTSSQNNSLKLPCMEVQFSSNDIMIEW